MTSSGTYSFSPSIGEVGLYSYGLCGVRATALAQEHMESLRMAANMVLLHWSNKQVNLWKVELVTVPFVQGNATYPVDPSVVVILDAWISIPDGAGGGTTDRYIMPISRTEYASYSEKMMPGFPTTYWFDRLLSPTVTLWPVPYANSNLTFNYYAVQQTQDAGLQSGQTADIPPIWIPAFAYGLAEELAVSWAPEKLALISPRAKVLYDAAAATNVEASSFYISPSISSYWRT